MRRSVNSILVLLLALGVLAPAFAQEQPARQRMSPEERQKLRERWQNMSEEERAAARARLARSAPGRPAGEQQVPLRLIDAQIKQSVSIFRSQSFSVSTVFAVGDGDINLLVTFYPVQEIFHCFHSWFTDDIGNKEYFNFSLFHASGSVYLA